MKPEVFKTFLENLVNSKKNVSIRVTGGNICGKVIQFDEEVIEVINKEETESTLIFIRDVSAISEISEARSEKQEPQENQLVDWVKSIKQDPNKHNYYTNVTYDEAYSKKQEKASPF